jgi:outer membrane protein TolC
MYGNLMNFDRSLTLLQNPEDGTLKYVSSNNLQNGAGLEINQNITFTGGTLSVSSDLSRIDQFGGNKSLTWYSRPVTVSYYQPLFTYNQFKWDKKIEPKAYEKGKRDYLGSMEAVTINVVYAYHNLLLAKMNNEISQSNFENSGNMLKIAKERLQLGDVTKADYLQLELRMLNDSIAINETEVMVREAQMTLNSLLGFDESFESGMRSWSCRSTMLLLQRHILVLGGGSRGICDVVNVHSHSILGYDPVVRGGG